MRVGPLGIGGDNPILIQSMTIADTLDTEAVVREIRDLVGAGCPLVRLTAPSLRHAANLREIRRRLSADGIRVPMVADIHFTPNAAVIAAEIVEKVRINPGNYADRKKFVRRSYTEGEYAVELERVAEAFRPLVRALKASGAALRIGTNHGSLSDRILNRFGDTPEGMVESALEFVRICEAEGYREIVLSMKSSIPGIMIAAYRLLVQRMDELGMDYPLHLGVTEAGDGLEARIKSASGIGSLLADGIGDTIRVSLTEDSRHEIPAARAILDAVERERSRVDAPQAVLSVSSAPPRRSSLPCMFGEIGVGGSFPVRVEAHLAIPATVEGTIKSDAIEIPPGAEILSVGPFAARQAPGGMLALLDRLRAQVETMRKGEPGSAPPSARPALLLEADFHDQGMIHLLEAALPLVDGLSLSPWAEPELPDGERDAPLERVRLLARLLARTRKPVRWRVWTGGSRTRELAGACREQGLAAVGFLCRPGPRWIPRMRDLAASLEQELLFLEVPAFGPGAPLLAGSALHDGLGDALHLIPGEAPPWPSGGRSWQEDPVRSAYAILQACRLRLTRAEFIACPSCGRTQFDLQSTTARIRARTEHLKGVKIAVMGCIVNGPGEMADADFGYVGSGPGRVDLYCGRERVRQGLPEAEATERLVDLIRERGMWVDG